MGEADQDGHIRIAAAWYTNSMFRSLLVPIDLSPGFERVIERAALLPLARKARLTLLHVVPKRLPRPARGSAEIDARKALDAAASRVTRTLPESVTIQRVVKVGSAAAEIARHAQSVKAELIVMGRGGGRALRDSFLGSTAERVIRHGQLPVLVVRQPARARYQRPLLAVDLDPVARDVVALMLRVIPPPRPQIALVHVYDTPYQGLIYPSFTTEQAQEYRKSCRQRALRELERLLATAPVQGAQDDEISWKPHIRYGSPRIVIPKTVARTGADLLTLGTHGYSGLAHAFLGTVAGDVLREVPCDVLVVPPRRDAGTT
jgi:nucleotide-binding universal stress UspA family protein